MSPIDTIKQPVAQELKVFESYFKKSLKSKVPLLDIITNYILRRKGKQMRPMFVFLTARMFGEIKEATYVAATLIELLHTATLVHDDVVDNSKIRRGFFSINALWKSKIAVLTGDYLLSKGLITATENKQYELLEIVSEAVKEMAEGELLQIEKARKLDISEEAYFDIIQKKTATLIASCTAAGAKSAGADDTAVKNMKEFGMMAGIAFQIKDDLFDYNSNNKTGKPAGNDIREKKMTLPLIFALQNSSKKERRKIIKKVKKKKKSPHDIKTVVDFVNDKGGIDYARKIMLEYRDKSEKILEEFDPSDANKSLKSLLYYVTERKK
ncbi:MAG: polyprenyl synthetase family protein [Bacteroidota bacterium]|nr:polyprenyl synthetase family protein [Bacteroidota bacterium]